jgi:hypothetical protein
VFFSKGIYPTKTGRYHYYDDEGYVDVYEDSIHNNPTQNADGYRHPHMNLPSGSFSYVLQEKKSWFFKNEIIKCINVEQVWSVATGPSTSHAYYRASVSDEPAYPVVDFDPTAPVESVKLLQLHDNQRYDVTARNKDISVKAHCELKWTNIHIDHEFLAYCNRFGVGDPSSENGVRMQLSLRSKFNTERALENRPAPIEYHDLETFNYFTQEWCKKVKYNTTVNNSPINRDACLKGAFIEESAPWFFTRFYRRIRDSIKRFFGFQTEYKDFTKDLKFSSEGRARLTAGRTVTSTHFRASLSKKFFHHTGNANLRLTKEPKFKVCSCGNSNTYEKVIPVINPVHFGKCVFNTEACLKARGFNSTITPDPEITADFRLFVIDYLQQNSSDIRANIRSLTRQDFSVSAFLADVAKVSPSKGALYKKGFESFLKTRKIDIRLKMFCKPDEVHYDDISEVRPRMIFNPSSSLKAVGAYIARLMIKVIKSLEPGFISGYSTTNLGKKMSDLRAEGIFNDASVYSYDGSSHDAHQHLSLIKSVDHIIGNFLLEALFQNPNFPIDPDLQSEISRALFSDSYKFTTDDGYAGVITGTVFSGHPTLTTLFNTLRTILYNKFILTGLGYKEFMVWAAGDDVLVWVRNLLREHALSIPKLLGNSNGSGGLGQLAKDFILGTLDQHTFLSKRYYSDANIFCSISERLYKAGAVRNVKSITTISEHALAMMISELDLPQQIYELVAGRFREEIKQISPQALQKLMINDYGLRLRLLNDDLLPNSVEALLRSVDDWYLLFLRSRTHTPAPSVATPVPIKKSKQGKVFDPTVENLNQYHQSMADYAGVDSEKNSNILPEGFLFGEGLRRMRAGNSTPRTGAKNLMNKLEKKQAKKEKKIQQRVVQIKQARKGLKNKDKRVRKGLKKLNSLQDWTDAHQKAEYLYALGLFDPRSVLADRVPSVLPIGTAVASSKGIITLAASATGYLALGLDPYANNPILYNNLVALTDMSAISFGSATGPNNIMSTANATRFRVVSAFLGVVDLSTALTKTGLISTGCIPYSQCLGTGASTSDTIRDALYVTTTSSQEVTDYRGGFFIPMDDSAQVFYGFGGRPNDFESPIVFCSALAPNANVSVQYHINYEFIPATSQTDLLPTKIGPIGEISKSLALASEVRHERSVRKEGETQGYSKNLFEKLNLGTIFQGLEIVTGIMGLASIG